jgi:two-component sensor histidine kinase
MQLKPAINFSNYYEKARFDLTWKINLFLSVTLPILAISFYIFGQVAFVPTLIAWVATAAILLVMKMTKQYRIPAFIFTTLGVILCSFTLIAYPHAFHLVDTLWMIIAVLYAYFTLGKLWGNIALFISVVSVIYFINFALNQSIKVTPLLSNPEVIALSVNASICGIIIGYLIYQFINTNQFAEKNYLQLTTELQQKNQEVNNQSEEKTVMLREIHHRVKNNLQVITSLLRLQARETEDPQTLELFKDSTNRVIAMALIHEKMYQTKDLAKINLEDYLRTLLTDLIDSYAIEIPIDSDIRSNVEMISNKSLVPLALLFNELVSNSLKHGFNDKKDGKIKIDIFRDKGKIVLSYWDNGVWREKQKETSFGLELIESLTEQMDGKYKRSTTMGTSYEFILPDNL